MSKEFNRLANEEVDKFRKEKGKERGRSILQSELNGRGTACFYHLISDSSFSKISSQSPEQLQSSETRRAKIRNVTMTADTNPQLKEFAKLRESTPSPKLEYRISQTSKGRVPPAASTLPVSTAASNDAQSSSATEPAADPLANIKAYLHSKERGCRVC